MAGIGGGAGEGVTAGGGDGGGQRIMALGTVGKEQKLVGEVQDPLDLQEVVQDAVQHVLELVEQTEVSLWGNTHCYQAQVPRSVIGHLIKPKDLCNETILLQNTYLVVEAINMHVCRPNVILWYSRGTARISWASCALGKVIEDVKQQVTG
jgi:hypothetical protein